MSLSEWSFWYSNSVLNVTNLKQVEHINVCVRVHVCAHIYMNISFTYLKFFFCFLASVFLVPFSWHGTYMLPGHLRVMCPGADVWLMASLIPAVPLPEVAFLKEDLAGGFKLTFGELMDEVRGGEEKGRVFKIVQYWWFLRFLKRISTSFTKYFLCWWFSSSVHFK